MNTRARDTGVVVGVLASVAGAYMASASLRGLVDERDHLRSQVGALSHQAAAPAVSAPQVGAPPHGGERVRFVPARPGGGLVVEPATRITPGPASAVPKPKVPAPHPRPAPSPAPAGPHTAGCSPALLAAQLPLRALPCGTLTVAHVARVGGTAK